MKDVTASSGNEQSRLKFSDFRALLTKVKNLPVAIQEAVDIATCFPCGPDRASLYKFGLYLNNKWLQEMKVNTRVDQEEHREEAQGSLERIKELYSRTENETLLRSNDFLDLLDLVANPFELIRKLYFGKSHLAYWKKISCNLHSLVTDVAKRHGIDVDVLRRELLAEWLAQDILQNVEDRKLYLPSSRLPVNNVLNAQAEKDHQAKALYLLQSIPVQEAILTLGTVAMKPSAKILLPTRIRALSVLLQLATPESLDHERMKQETLRECLQLYLYLADFEELGIVISTSEFKNCDKEALVRRLWVNHRDNVMVCLLCIFLNRKVIPQLVI